MIRLTTLSLLLLLSVSAQSLELARNGKTGYVINAPKSPSPSVKYAAAELSRFLREISSAKFPSVSEDANSARQIILRLPETEALAKQLGDEGYRLQTVNGNLVITGSGKRGILYGVYGLLSDHLGCRWFTPDVSTIPKRPHLVLPPLDETIVPKLAYRWPAVKDCYDGDWCARNRVNVGPKLKAKHGGSVKFHGWAHTFSALVPVEKYYGSHPEYFSLVKGRRLNARSQLCCTNEEVIQLCIQGIRRRMREHPEATYYSVSQNDWGNYCQCEACQKLAKREESQMAPVLQLVNRVAAAVEQEFPDKRVTTLAYQWTRKPPKTIRPRPNVTIRLCTIECCFAHPMQTCDFPANQLFRTYIKDWAAICNDLWIWNYTTNFKNYYLPHPSLRAVDDSIRFFVANNVKGIYEQDTKLTDNSDQALLGGYIMAQYLWNPDYEEKTAIGEFMNAVYGPAAPSMLAYFNLLHDSVDKSNIHLRCYTLPNAKYLTPEFLSWAQQLFDQAETAAANQAKILTRIRNERMSVDFACIEQIRRNVATEYQINHQNFTVTPRNSNSLDTYIQRFFATAVHARVQSLSERKFTLDEYRQQIAHLTSSTLVPEKPVADDGLQPGLHYASYEYQKRWSDSLLKTTKPVKAGTVPLFDLSVRTRDSMFAVLFEGFYFAEKDGIYTFRVRAEGGSSLTVGGKTTISGKRMSAAQAQDGFVALKKGWHPIRLLFREFGYNDGLSIQCIVPDGKAEPISASKLMHRPIATKN